MTVKPDRSLLSQLRQWLSAAELPESGRLPPERSLAEQFHVTRAELRKALAVLETEGRLRRHVGRGTFLTSPGGVSRSRIDELAEGTTPRDAMQAWLVVEAELARLAALNATTAQIAEASDSPLLVEVHHIINGVRRKVVWGHLNVRPVGPSADYHSFNEHDAIVEAIANRDRRGAIEAMCQHHNATMATLIDDIGDGAPAGDVAPPRAAQQPETFSRGR